MQIFTSFTLTLVERDYMYINIYIFNKCLLHKHLSDLFSQSLTTLAKSKKNVNYIDSMLSFQL